MDSDSSHTIEVAVEAESWRSAVTDPEQLCRRAVAAVLATEMGDPVEVSVLLADDATVTRLNRDYRGKDKPTNVLSFPADAPVLPDMEEPRLLGDVVVALETTAREAAAAGRPLADHLTHLVVHGTLHLCGFDHEAEDEALRMEARETALLAGLGIADPYAAAVPA
jgi:probable rRNA maturation factor